MTPKKRRQAERDFDLVIFLLALFSAGFILAGHGYIGAIGMAIVATFCGFAICKSRREEKQRAAARSTRFQI